MGEHFHYVLPMNRVFDAYEMTLYARMARHTLDCNGVGMHWCAREGQYS